MGFTGTGIQWWDDVDGPYVNLASQQIAASLDPLVNGSFPSTAARDTAYSGMIASGKKGMACYVANYGQCYYDGNHRSGSRGWTWLAESTPLWEARDLLAHAVTSDVVVVTSDVLTLTSPRNILVRAACTYEADYLPPLGVRLDSVVTATGGMPLSIVLFAQLYSQGPPGATSVSANYQNRAPAGALQLTWTLHTPLGGTSTDGGILVWGNLQIVDMGPTD